MNDGVNWVEIVVKIGIPAALILFGGWFFIRELWPWAKKQFEDLVARQRADLDRFIESLSTRDKMTAEANRETIKTLEALTSEVRGLRDDVTELRGGQKTPRQPKLR